MKNSILIFTAVAVFVYLFVGFVAFEEIETENLNITSTGEKTFVEKEKGSMYQKGQKILIAKIVKQNKGKSSDDWFMYSDQKQFSKDTLLKDVLFERSDAPLEGDPLTHGDIQIRIAIVQ